MSQNGIVKAEDSFELSQCSAITFDVHQDIVGFVQLGNGKCQLTTAPVFQAVNRTVATLNQGTVTFQHGRNLLALVRMNQKTYFVVSHCDSLWVCQCENRTTKAPFIKNIK